MVSNKSSVIQIIRGYKTELKLNNHQRFLCIKHAGCSRFAYNWGLQRKKEIYEATGRFPSAIDLHRELNRLKKTKFPWMYEVSKCAPQGALRNLDNAFHHFFRGKREEKNIGFPRFKSRKHGIGSFQLTGTIRVFENKIQLPRLGKLRLKEKGYLPKESDSVHILSATVSEKMGRWFVSLQVQEQIEITNNEGPIVGVDLGVISLATVSDGTVVNNPRVLKRFERKLIRIHKSLSRKRQGSKNRWKTKRQLQILYKRITNIRLDTIHKLTSKLAKTKSVIGIENLNVSGLLKNHFIAKAVSDVCFYEFRRQLTYKTKWYGSELVLVDPFYPSSKLCSRCGKIKRDQKLSNRQYVCNHCGLKIDRDMNASINLAAVAASSAETINACCEVGGYSHIGAVPIDDAGTEQKFVRFS